MCNIPLLGNRLMYEVITSGATAVNEIMAVWLSASVGSSNALKYKRS